MIDPQEAFITFLAADSAIDTLTSSQVAARNRFGDEWAIDSSALTAVIEPGNIDPYTKVIRQRFELRAFGSTPYQAMRVARAAADAIWAIDRDVVAVTEGNVMLYDAQINSSFSTLSDDVTNSTYILFFAEVRMASDTH